MKEVYEFALQLAEKAGQNTLRYFGQKMSIEQKADDSPVTIADRTTEELIRREIENHFPNDGILGEEFGEKNGTSGIRWILDPIDGTKTFIRGIPMYGTLIAVEKDGKSEIGVIHYPPLNLLLSARNGHGCFCNNDRCQISSTPSLSESTAMITDFSDILEHHGEKVLINILRKTNMQRTWADCYGYYLLATGKVDIMMDATVKIWDIAPLIPIIQEAGGTITNIHNETHIHIKNAVGTNGLLHKEFLQILAQ
jgi:histidinol-phosphatase